MQANANDIAERREQVTHLTSEKEEDVAFRLGQVDLHDCDECGVHVVGLRRAAVQDLHRVCAPGDGEDGAAKKVGRKLIRVQRCRGHNQLQVRPPLDDALMKAEMVFRMLLAGRLTASTWTP